VIGLNAQTQANPSKSDNLGTFYMSYAARNEKKLRTVTGYLDSNIISVKPAPDDDIEQYRPLIIVME
jgi:hypothetical protein